MIRAVDVALDSGKYDYADWYANGIIKVKKSFKKKNIKKGRL